MRRIRRVRRPQLVAHRCAIPDNRWGNGVNGRSDTRAEARIKLKIGPSDVSNIELAFCNFYAPGNAAVEAAIGNDITVEGAIELLASVVAHRAWFGGSTSALVQNGCPIRRSDPLPIQLAANSGPFARIGWTISGPTLNYPAGNKTVHSQDSGSVNTAGASQVLARGAMAAAGGSGGTYILPAAVLGIPVKRHPSVGFLGNSIAQGTGDTTDGNGNIGFIQRGLYSVNWGGQVGVTIPSICMAVGGDVLANNLDNLISKRAF